jgi:hypothetical protein
MLLKCFGKSSEAIDYCCKNEKLFLARKVIFSICNQRIKNWSIFCFVLLNNPTMIDVREKWFLFFVELIENLLPFSSLFHRDILFLKEKKCSVSSYLQIIETKSDNLTSKAEMALNFKSKIIRNIWMKRN